MSLMRRGFCPWALVVAQAAIVSPALAQIGTGTFTGKVSDAATKSPVPDAVVTVTSPALQGEQIAVTDASGTFRIPNLPPGEYQLRVEKESFKPFARAAINLRADTTLKVDTQLLPEAVESTEVIVAENPTVDVSSSNVSTSIDSNVLRSVPLTPMAGKGSGTKSFEQVAAAAPGARSDQYGVSIAGTTSPENSYLVDGVSTKSPDFGLNAVALSTEFIKEVNVIAGGYMPEYGRTTGGAVTAVTKSGSNEFHAGIWGEWTPGGLAGNPKIAQSAAQTFYAYQKLNNIFNVGADVGGPIIKDKLWFYVGLQYSQENYNYFRGYQKVTTVDITRDRKNVPPLADGTMPQIRGRVPVQNPDGTFQLEKIANSELKIPARKSDLQVFAKFDFQINSSNKLILSLNYLPSRSGGSDALTISPDTGGVAAGAAATFNTNSGKQSIDVFTPSLHWTSDFDNKKALVDTHVAWVHSTREFAAVDGTTAGMTTGLAGTPQVVLRRTQPRHGLNDVAAYENQMYQQFAGINAPIPAVTDCQDADPITAATVGTTKVTCPIATYAFGGPGPLFLRKVDSYQAGTAFTYYGQAAGHHIVKAGIDFEYKTWDSLRAFSGGSTLREGGGAGGNFLDYRNYYYMTSPDEIVQNRSVHFKNKSTEFGGFLQDSWSVVDKITLNVGTRYDAQFIYAGNGNHLSLPNQWSPRVGLVFDPTQNGRAKIYANYALFYQSVPLDLADRSLSGEPGINAVRGDTQCNAIKDPNDPGCKARPTGPGTPSDNGTPANPNRFGNYTGNGTMIDPNIVPSSSNEFVGGAEYDVFRNARVGVRYEKRWIGKIVEDLSNDEASTYFLGNPGYGAAAGFPKAQRDYDAGTIELTKLFADGWSVNASYTLARLYGNWSGLFRPDNGQLDPNITSDFDLKSLLINQTGPLPGDRRHQMKVFGSKKIDLPNQMELTLGGFFRASSGDPSNTLGSHEIYGRQVAYIFARGSGERLPWQASLDPQVGFGVRFAEGRSLGFTVGVTNLLNFQSGTGRDQEYTTLSIKPLDQGQTLDQLTRANGQPFYPDIDRNYNFGRINAYQPPRYVRFGIRASF